ncbi:MAG: YihY/virulence factor BrkB family protein [Haloferacaceae archaeon]
MHPRLARAAEIGRAVVHEVRTENLTFVAGSIAYHAFVSILPLFLLLLAVLAAVGSRGLESSVLALVEGVFTRGAREVLLAEIRAASDSTSLSVFGALVLLWGTLRVFRGLDTAFSTIYETEAANTAVDQVTDGLLVLLTVAAAIAAGAAVQGALPGGDGPLPWLARRVALVAGLVVTLYPMYYVFPDADVGPVEPLPGVVVTAVGLSTFHGLFRVYLEVSARQPGRSVVAGILVFLTWLYVSSLVVLLGAAVNAVASNRSRDVNVAPLVGGVQPDAGRGPDRATVVAALHRVERLLDGADGGREAGDSVEATLVISVDDERVTLPLPDGVVTRTERSRLLPGGEVGVDLRWSPRE